MTTRRWSFSVAIVLVALLSGCLPSTVDSPGATADNEITVVLGASGGALNPYSPLEANRQVGELLFRGLTDVSNAGTPVPDLLAELPTRANGGISADGRTVRLRLKAGVRWHDGQPLTSADVVYTLGLLKDGALTDEPMMTYGHLQTAAVVSDTEISVRLSTPDSPFVWRMAPYVLPMHLLATETPVASAHYWFRPVGSGPYRVDAAVPGASVSLRPVASDGSVPLRIVFSPTAEGARAEYDDAAAAVWVDGPTAAAGPAESVSATASTTWRMLAFNRRKGSLGADPAVRRAYLGLYPYETASPPADPFGLPLRRRRPMTPEQALTLLTADGWRSADGTGQPLRRGGKRLEPTTAIRTILSEELPMFEGITASMGEAGIGFKTYSLDDLDIGGYLERDYLSTHDWDVARTRYYVGAPYGVAWPFGSSDVPSWDDPYGGNVFGVRDTGLDRLYGRLLAAGDPAEAAGAWKRLGQRLNALDFTSWERPETNYVLSKSVNGAYAVPAVTRVLSEAPRWRLRDPSPSE